MFVWNAMSSITLMILEMLEEASSISAIAVSMAFMRVLPWSAFCLVVSESWLAWEAYFAFWLVLPAMSSSEALNCSMALACWVEPWDSDSPIEETWLAAEATFPEASLMPPIVSASLSTKLLRDAAIAPISSFVRTSSREVRSPSDSSPISFTVLFSGLVM